MPEWESHLCSEEGDGACTSSISACASSSNNFPRQKIMVLTKIWNQNFISSWSCKESSIKTCKIRDKWMLNQTIKDKREKNGHRKRSWYKVMNWKTAVKLENKVE